MLILRAGLYVSVGLAVLATGMSMDAGYPLEVASVRGLLAFMAGGLVSYVGELVVMTAPPAAGSSASRTESDREDADASEGAEEPVSLPAVRAGRDAAPGDRRAA